MTKRREAITIASTLLVCLALGGCGGSNSASSSTNDTQEPPTGSTNQAPTARISAPASSVSGETVSLDGGGSSDPDGDSLSFLWVQTGGPSISLNGSSNSLLSFVAPSVSQPTQLAFRLTVDDGELSDSSQVNLQISPLIDNTPPSVTGRSPAPDQQAVATTTQILISFNEALDPLSVSATSLTLSQGANPISGSVSYRSSDLSIRLTPDNPLAAATEYRVTLSNEPMDLAGNRVTAESWDFTTASGYNLGATTQETIDLCMDDNDKEMLTLVNNTRGASRDCGTTHYPAVPPLAWHCLLENAAQGHSTSMAQNDFFDHVGLNGSSPGDRISAAGYTWTAYGENIAAGYGDAQAAMSAWIGSPGHCANLMSSRFEEMGAAMATDAASTYGIYWTQNFAAP